MANPLGSQRGLALITVLLLSAILIAIAGEFVFRVYLFTARVGNLRGAAQASVLSADGVLLAKAGIEELLRTDPKALAAEGGLTFTRKAGESTIEIRAVDERSKVSARVAYPETGLADARVDGEFRRLLRILGLDERLADALADWIDKNDDRRPYGAETADYRALVKPYGAANRYPATVDELLLVKGFTPEAYSSLSPFLTVYSPDGLINVNTAPKTVLMALSEDITDGLAGRLIAYRKQTPFRNRSDVMRVPGFERIGFALQDRITAESKIFRVFVRTVSGEAVREAEAVIEAGGGILYWRER